MSIRDFLGVFLLAAFWSPTFLFVKIGIEELPPLTFTFVRCLIAFTTLALFAIWTKHVSNLMKNKWKALALSGLIGNALPFALCCIGETQTSSSMAGVIEGTVPLFTLVFTFFFLPKERLKRHEVAGILMGLCGLACIFAPKLLEENNGTLVGELLVVGMAASFATGFIYAKIKFTGDSPLAVITCQMFFATLWLAPLSLIFDAPWNLSFPSSTVFGALLNLGAFSTALGWLHYYYLMDRLTPSQISLATYFCPVGSIILGITFLNEEIYWNQSIGAAVIILAMAIAGGVVKLGTLPIKDKTLG